MSAGRCRKAKPRFRTGSSHRGKRLTALATNGFAEQRRRRRSPTRVLGAAGRLVAAVVLASVLLVGRASAGEPDLERVRRAVAAMNDDAWSLAANLLDDVDEPVLRTYLTWRRLRGDDRPSFAAYRGFLARHPRWPERNRLLAAAEEAIDEDVPHPERLAFFAERAPSTRQGRIRLAAALAAGGRSAEAAALVRASWAQDDYSASEERYVLDLYGSYLRPQDHRARLDRLLWLGETADAQRMLPLVGPASKALARARLRLQASAKGAEDAWRAVPRELQGDPGLLFDRLRWHRRKGQDAAARQILLQVRDESTRSDDWWTERSYQIREAIDDRDFPTAYRLARAHRQREGASFADAEWTAGWLALRFLKRPADAVGHFERLWAGVTTPISRGRAAYWTGRALAASGRKDEAAGWYRRAAAFPTTYYGQLAAHELKTEPVLEPWERNRPAPALRAAFAAKDELARLVTILCRAGAHRETLPFLHQLATDATGDPARLRLVVELAAGCGRPDLVVIVAKAAARDGALDPAAGFPVPELAAFRKPGADMPEAALLLALARQESQFDPTVTSSAGAIGLMQLMPATARAVAGELDLPFSAARLTRDPGYNVRLGSWYLRQQLARFDNSTPLALAAYNAGPPRVASWLGRHGDPREKDAYAMIDWIELIPFRETRNYVQRVLEGAQVYRSLLRRDGHLSIPLAAGLPPTGTRG